MKTEQVNLRLEEDILADIEHVAREESLDRSVVIRRLLKESVARWRLDHALRGYERGDLSIGRAAEEAGLSQWELMDEISRANTAYPMKAADVHERLVAFEQRLGLGAPRSLPGFQSEEPWMGTSVVTLADLPPKPGGVLLVGINPAPASVAAGHYYQGKLGRRLWARLMRLGLLDSPTHGAEDEAFALHGNGLTDIVKRPTDAAAGVSDDELAAGAVLLGNKVRTWKPGLILFAFKRAATALLGSSNVTPGSGPAFEGAATFLLTGPYAPAAEAERIDKALAKLIGHEVHPSGRPSHASVDASDVGRSAADPVSGDVDREATIASASRRFGPSAVHLYMDSTIQSEAARALGVPGLRLRNITRALGTRVSEGDPWDERAKLLTLAELMRRMDVSKA